MADTIKEKVADAGQKVADTVKTVSHKVAEGAEKATGYVKEKTGLGGPAEGTNAGVAGIKERMDVIASCGKKVGVVDHVEGGAIKLTKNDSKDGQHHFIPEKVGGAGRQSRPPVEELDGNRARLEIGRRRMRLSLRRHSSMPAFFARYSGRGRPSLTTGSEKV